MRPSLLLAPIAAALAVSGSAHAQLKPDTAGIHAQSIEVTSRPIASFHRDGRSAAPSARLVWRGGVVLTSSSPYFGGWSGLTLSKDGTRFASVSDAGLWMTGEIAYGENNRPTGLRGARIGALQTKSGAPLAKQRDRDAEGLALVSGTPESGTAYISFEQHDRIGLFPLGKAGVGKPASYITLPPEAKRMRTDGFEAITVLAGGARKGSLVGFSEHPLRGEKQHRGWIWIGGTPRGFTLAGIGGYGITDAASLSDGSVVIVERRFNWLEGVKIRIRLLAASEITPGATAKGEVLLEADRSAEIDNLEALAVSRDAAGATVLTLMSDDNYNRLFQRTLLLQFTLKERATAGVEASPSGKEQAKR